MKFKKTRLQEKIEDNEGRLGKHDKVTYFAKCLVTIRTMSGNGYQIPNANTGIIRGEETITVQNA